MNRTVATDFDHIILKAQKKVAQWGLRLLSMAGRSALIKSVLFALPTFAATHSLIPKSIVHEVEKIGRNFLWNHSSTKNSLHLVDWDSVCQPTSMGGLGIPSVSKRVAALRSRLAWNVLTEPPSLLHSCLLTKYGQLTTLGRFRNGCSPTWRILSDGASSLNMVTRWKVGNGESISFCDHAWILNRPFNRWPTFLDCSSSHGTSVADFILPDGTWDRPKLAEIVGPTLLDRIISTPIDVNLRDQIESNALLSGKSISSLAYAANFHSPKPMFGWIWKLLLPPRVQIFWWKVLSDALPTFPWLARRGLASSRFCFWGCGVEESIDHIMCDCLKLLQVTSRLLDWGLTCPRFANKEEGFRCFEAHGNDAASHFVPFCIAVYLIWLARNDARAHRPTHTSAYLASLVFGESALLLNPPHREQWHTIPPNVRLASSFLWCPPPPRWLKVNFDGSLLPNHLAGLGVVCRDEHGTVLKLGGKFLEHWDSGAVEMLACQFIAEILEVQMLERSGIIVEGDNANVINFLHHLLFDAAWREKPQFRPLVDLLLQFSSVKLSLVPRRLNCVADFCAQVAIRRLNSFCWDCVPSDESALQLLVQADLPALV